MRDTVTFRQLELSAERIAPTADGSALDEWYSRVRDLPIQELDDGDLSRACRQRLYLDHVVPIAVRRLTSYPLAGEIYDGELLAAMKAVPIQYWQRNRQIAQELAKSVEKVQQLAEDEDMIADADEVGQRIRGER